MTDLLTPTLKAKLATLGSSETFTISRREALLVRDHIARLEAQLAGTPEHIAQLEAKLAGTPQQAQPLLAPLAPPFDPRPILQAVEVEARSAHKTHGYYYSAHHGWGVMAEELRELFDEICINQSRRDLDHLRKEAVQVVACAVRIVALVDAGRGRV
jgi:hypothetical protein